VEDDSRTMRLSTSRIEVNVKQVRQGVCGDFQLTAQMIEDQLDTKKEHSLKDYNPLAQKHR